MNATEKMPLVSAVIPTRNRPEMVCRAVRSVLRQTYANLEIVVVVDGPDPATVAALEGLHEPRIRVIDLKENVGGAEARNIGVREACGQWIALLDDDDEWLPNKLDVQMQLANSCDVEPLITSRYFVRGQNRPDMARPRRLPREGEDLADYGFDAFCGFQTSTYLCPRSLLLRVPFTRGLPCMQDWDWWLRLIREKNFRLLISEIPLSIYYRSEGRPSVTSAVKFNARLEYGRQHRNLFTKRAYGLFLARLASHAGGGPTGWKARRELLDEMFSSRTMHLRALLLLLFLSVR